MDAAIASICLFDSVCSSVRTKVEKAIRAKPTTNSSAADSSTERESANNPKATAQLKFTENAANTAGILSVHDEHNLARIALFGQFISANFAMQSDGHGGTDVTDPPDSP